MCTLRALAHAAGAGSGSARRAAAAGPRLQQLEELGLARRQRLARQHLEQVAKVVAAVERDPLHLRAAHRPAPRRPRARGPPPAALCPPLHGGPRPAGGLRMRKREGRDPGALAEGAALPNILLGPHGAWPAQHRRGMPSARTSLLTAQATLR